MSVLITLIVFTLATEINPLLQISFILNLLLISIGVYHYLNLQSFNIANGVVLIFFFLFYFIAPLLQLEKNSFVLINTLKPNLNSLLITNIYVFIFIFSYLLTLFLIKKEKKIVKTSISFHFNDKLVFFILFVLSILIAIKAYGEILNIISNLNIDFESESNGTLKILLEGKVIKMLPYVTLSVFALKKKLNFRTSAIFAILIILVFITKNPLLDRRNALGPIYLSIFIILFGKYFNSNLKIFLFFMVSMLVFFPLSSLLTHMSFERWGTNSIDYISVLKKHFTDLHYDAWANITAGISYVEKKGFTYGNQVLGTIGFWIPRSLWENKAIATGELVGNFLMQFEDLYFNNISATLILEGFIDFGIIGIIIYGILLALFVSLLESMYFSNNAYNRIFSIYASIFLFFLLRGALLPAVAYLSGAWIAIIFIPYFAKKTITLLMEYKTLKVKL